MKILINSKSSTFGGFLLRRLLIDGNQADLVVDDEAMYKKAKAEQYDLVIIATRFQFMRSLHTLQLMREGTRVFILSTVSDEDTVLLAYKAGAAAYMTLPMDTGKFIRKIRAI